MYQLLEFSLKAELGLFQYVFPDCAAHSIFVRHVAGGQPGVSNLTR